MVTVASEMSISLYFSSVTSTSGGKPYCVQMCKRVWTSGNQEKLLLAVKRCLLRESFSCIPLFCPPYSFILLCCYCCTTSVCLSVHPPAFLGIRRPSLVPMVTGSGSLMRSNVLSSADRHADPASSRRAALHRERLFFASTMAPPGGQQSWW